MYLFVSYCFKNFAVFNERCFSLSFWNGNLSQQDFALWFWDLEVLPTPLFFTANHLPSLGGGMIDQFCEGTQKECCGTTHVDHHRHRETTCCLHLHHLGCIGRSGCHQCGEDCDSHKEVGKVEKVVKHLLLGGCLDPGCESIV